jgi:hypothetical protein
LHSHRSQWLAGDARTLFEASFKKRSIDSAVNVIKQKNISQLLGAIKTMQVIAYFPTMLRKSKPINGSGTFHGIAYIP